MAFQTRAVRQRIVDLANFYVSEGRDTALEKLIQTLEQAECLLDQPEPLRNIGTFPSTYRQLSLHGFRWFKLRVYWLGYADHDGKRTLTNFFYETNDMPNQLLLDTNDIVEL